MTTQLGIIGAQGKMGSRIINCAAKDPTLTVSWGITSQKTDFSTLSKTDVIIDFSTPLSFKRNLTYALDTKTPFVIGTTGLSEEDKEGLKLASLQIPILWSANFSLGMTAVTYVSEILASLLQKNFTPHIQETHHIHKKDSPSGTALVLAESIEKGSGFKPCIESSRTGEVIGEHSVSFLGEHEKITLSHEAFSRDAFAFGALEAAKFLEKAHPGLYQVRDIFASIKSKS